MSVELQGIRLPLARFTLELDAVFPDGVTALFGASGSGKTSVLELIAGLRRPSAGTIRVNGRVLTDISTRQFVRPEDRHLGYVPQEGALFPHLTVRANLLYSRPSRQASDPALTLEHVAEVLEIASLLERNPASISGGEKQRVALGRALLAAPTLLLLDEPLAGLDLPLRERLLPYLQRVRDEFRIPMIYVTHSPGEVVALCPQAVVLDGGRIVQQGATRDLFTPSTAAHYVWRPPHPSSPA